MLPPMPALTLSIALAAALLTQLGHESCHGVAAWLVGGDVLWFNLFAVDSQLPTGAGEAPKALVAASAALMNMAIGVLSAASMRQTAVRRRPGVRLFAFYMAAFGLLTGFGYLLIDALFYQPGALGDWKTVIAVLGGSAGPRMSIGAIGAAGVLYTFFWLPHAALSFVADPTCLDARRRFTRVALLGAYLMVAVLVTTLAIWHPLGSEAGVFIVGSHYFFGYFAVAWGFPMATYWSTKRLPPSRECTPLDDVSPMPWVGLATGMLIVAVVALFA